MRFFRNLVVIAAFATTFAAAAPVQAKSLKIGYVNLQRAIREVAEGKRATERLRKTFEKKQKTLRAKEKELEGLKKQLEQASVVKDQSATRAQKLEFQKKYMELREVFMKEQQQLMKLEQDELSKITVKMRKIIKKVGKKGGYTIILEGQKARLLFAEPHLDLTNEIIRTYNGKHK